MADGLRVIEVDIDDIPSMERFVAFENSVRTERTRTVRERRGAAEWTSASAFYLVERAGELVATANAFVQDVDAGASVNLQVAMLDPYDAVPHVVAAVEAWRPAATPTRIVAHLVNAHEPELDAWAVLGFERVGTRTSWERRVDPGSTFELPTVPGVDVVELASRIDLLPDAHRVWCQAMARVPSELFSDYHQGYDDWRAELRTPAGEALHRSFLVAVDNATDRVVGIGYLVPYAGRPTLAGHRFTGVAEDWLGRGVARLLKVHTLAWAAANGITSVRATNDDANHAMLHLNRALGYELRSTITMLGRALQRTP